VVSEYQEAIGEFRCGAFGITEAEGMEWRGEGFTARLVTRLQELKMSQRKLAQLIGKSEGLISDWTKGKSVPTFEGVQAAAEAMGVRPGWLAFGEEPKEPRRELTRETITPEEEAQVDAVSIADRKLPRGACRGAGGGADHAECDRRAARNERSPAAGSRPPSASVICGCYGNPSNWQGLLNFRIRRWSMDLQPCTKPRQGGERFRQALPVRRQIQRVKLLPDRILLPSTRSGSSTPATSCSRRRTWAMVWGGKNGWCISVLLAVGGESLDSRSLCQPGT